VPTATSVSLLLASPYISASGESIQLLGGFGYESGRASQEVLLLKGGHLSFGFSILHWQQVEAGRPITVTTLLRICEVFGVPMSKLVRGLDKEGVYEKLEVEVPLRRRIARKE
jgi:transcriptional regulator with XRE-family HTH domain